MSVCVSCGVLYLGNCRCTFCCPAVVIDSDGELLHYELFSDAGDSSDLVDSLDSSAAETVTIFAAVVKPVQVLQLLVKLFILILMCFVLCGSD